MASDSVKWEVAVLLLIIANCVTLAMASPLDDPASNKAKVLSGIEMFFSIAFTLELLAKIVAMGFYTDDNAYMRDNWNILDFLIVTLGWLSEITGGSGGLTAMRAMRVLRPLRTIKGIPELKRIIEGLISSLPQLTTVFGLCFGCYILFGILGMQLFSGKMSQRCYDATSGTYDFDSGRFCSMDSNYGRQCPDGTTCGDSGKSLNDDITNFDDILRAFLTVFQSCTLEGWVDAMYCLMDTMPSFVPGFFFVTLIWVGSLFLLNLVTVVVYIAYSQSADKIAEMTNGPEGKEEFTGEVELVAHENLRRVQEDVKILASRAVEDLSMVLHQTRGDDGGESVGLRNRNGGGFKELDTDSNHAPSEVGTHDQDTASMKTDMLQHPDDETESLAHGVELSKVASLLSGALHQLQSLPNVVVHSTFHDVTSKKDDDGVPKYEQSPGKFICWCIVTNRWFTVFMNFLIVSNTVCLASEYYGQSHKHTNFLVTANYWFTFLFTFEIYAKLKGLGLDKFTQDAFNTFDSAIVFVSLIELMIGGEVRSERRGLARGVKRRSCDFARSEDTKGCECCKRCKCPSDSLRSSLTPF